MNRIITLTTDFGLMDEYVGVIKGVLLSRAPTATIVDLCHDIRPQDLRQAGDVILASYRFFPTGTIHLVVVDPGVGSRRRLVLLRADDHWFLAPDNGVLTPLLDPALFQAGFDLQCDHLYLTPDSNTFQSRDILAPVAGELAAGLDPTRVGPSLRHSDLHRLAPAEPAVDRSQGRIIGMVVDVDRFGNLRTDITIAHLQTIAVVPETPDCSITIKDHLITGLQPCYANAAHGTVLALVGSRDTVEISVNCGNAGHDLGAVPGDRVTISAASGSNHPSSGQKS